MLGSSNLWMFHIRKGVDSITPIDERKLILIYVVFNTILRPLSLLQHKKGSLALNDEIVP